MAWKVDPTASKVEFTIKHLMVTKARGRFESFEGMLNMDEEDPQASFVEGTIDVASIRTGIGLRDSNLRSSAYFDVKRFPKMTFRSTRIGPFEGDRFQVFGDLTIKETTRPVVFDIVNKGEVPGVQDGRRWTFHASIVLNRKDFGVYWNALTELGGLLLGDDVAGELELQMVHE
jgi:polyisoprenoid-binding protein YceI